MVLLQFARIQSTELWQGSKLRIIFLVVSPGLFHQGPQGRAGCVGVLCMVQPPLRHQLRVDVQRARAFSATCVATVGSITFAAAGLVVDLVESAVFGFVSSWLQEHGAKG